jgi:hypothetical protein
MINNFEHFSYTFWPFVCLLLRNVYSDKKENILICYNIDES